MKKVIYLLFLITTVAVAQKKHTNIKKGFGANGYDVVSYFNDKALEGKKEFSTTIDEVTYKFSSEENLLKFKADPTMYIPQYGGYCAYAIAVKGKKVGINPETFEIRDNKLYLFYNRGKTNTLQFWQKEGAEKLKNEADKKWEAIINK